MSSGMDTLRDADEKRMNARKRIGERWRALPKWQRRMGFVAFVIFLYYLPYLGIPGLVIIRTDYTEAGSDWSSTLFLCAIYVLIAIGLNVVIGLAGLLDLGYVGFFAIGAYSVALFGSTESPVVQSLQNRFNLSEDWAVAWAVCIPISIALTMISGVILGWPTLRLRGDYLAIVTLGFGEIIRIVARNAEFTNGNQGISAIPGPQGAPSADNNVFGLLDIKPWYWLAITVLIVVVIGVRRLEHSRVGRAWLAIREDEDAAVVMGVNAFKWKLWAFAIGAAVGGLSGFLFASRSGFIDPAGFNVNLSILFVAMVVIGGSGNMAGAIFGAFLLTYSPERLRSLPVIGDSITLDRPLIFGLALVIIMITRPQGLVPNRRRARELTDRKIEAEEAAADV